MDFEQFRKYEAANRTNRKNEMNRTEHLLSCLAEECCEVGQRVSKALRFGLSEIQPEQALTNADRIAGEIVDLLAVLEMLEEEGAIQVRRDPIAINRKKDKVRKFMQYAQECGALNVSTESDFIRSREATDAEVQAWVLRHDLNRGLSSDVDARMAFDDAQSVVYTKVDSTVI